jgi:S1-C subfamily serine protease
MTNRISDGLRVAAQCMLALLAACSSARSELQEGDVVVSVNGRQPATGAHALRILASCQPGKAAHLDVIRRHRAVTIDVALPR